MKRVFILTAAVLLMVTGIAVADHGGGMGGPGEMGPGGGPGGFDAHAIVGADGTVYVVTGMTSNGTTTETLNAISASGTKIWSVALANHARLVLSGTNLLQVSATKNSDGTITSTITAISTASGSTAWTKTINGMVGSLEPFNGGTYAFVITPATTSGGSATRSLVALGNDGSVLWTVTL